MKWTTQGFEAFRKGTFGNGGQNIYVSRNGVLQRIHRTNLTGSGFVDLVFCNSQNHEELVPIAIYPDPLNHPEIKRELYIGGAADAVVADFAGDGKEAMAWSCTWDGLTGYNVSALYYMTEDGPSAKYVTYLPACGASCVAAGDFNGDGQADLAFHSKGEIKIFFQEGYGFTAANFRSIPIKDVKRMATFQFPGDKLATLFLSKPNGSITMLRTFEADAKEEEFCGADPDYVEKQRSWDNYTQAVEEPTPKLRVITIKGIPYLTVFRKACLLLYPLTAKTAENPIRIDCPCGQAVEAGDIFGRGECDLLIAARDRSSGKECSYVYLGSDKGFSNDNRLSVPSYFACDAALGSFSGGKGLDLVISQCHTRESYDNDVLIYPTGTLKKPAIPRPTAIPAHDAFRSLVIHDAQGKSWLVVGNSHSGSFIGNPDNYVYLGSPTGFHVNDMMPLAGWGSVDMVCTDLNDNGRPDVVFANAAELSPWLDPGSYIHYQQPDGSYTRLPVCLRTYRAHGVVVGDLNHNGYLDLVFCGFDNPVLKVFYGSEKGYCEENTVEIRMEENGIVYKEPRFLSLADLNGDGYLDLIVSQISSEESFVLWGGPNGFSFDNKQVFKVRHACNSKVADLNGDGYPELLFGGHTQSAGAPLDAFLYIYWGGPNGFSESRRTELPSNAINSIAVADFNGDGLLDVFIASYQNVMERDLPSYIYWNSPEGFHADDRTPLVTHAVSGNLAADFDDDGYIDLAIANHKVNGAHIAYSTVWYNGKDGFNPDNTIDLPSRGIHGMGNVDPGNVLDRSFDEFYESEVHEIPEGCGIREIFWDADIPKRCDVFAQLRVADSVEELQKAPWLGPLNAEGRFNAHEQVDKDKFSGKYMQYRLILYAFNAVNTPRVRSVTVAFEKLD